MTAPTRLLGAASEMWDPYGLADVLEHIPDLLPGPLAVNTYARMAKDPTLSAILAGYTLNLRRAQWQIDGHGCRPEVVRHVADDLGLPIAGEDNPSAARVRGVSWHEHLRSALMMLTYGFACAELLAEVDDAGRAHLVALTHRIPWSIEQMHVDPKTGALLGVSQQLARGPRSPQIPADRVALYVHERQGANYWGSSLLRPSWPAWFTKLDMMRVHSTANTRFGMGVPVMEALPGTSPSEPQMREAMELAAAARAGNTAGAATPPGFTLKLIGLSGSVPATLDYIEWLDRQMVKSALMGHLDLGQGGNGGSRALASSFIDAWTLALGTLGESVCDVATRQIAARIVEWNHGASEPVPRVVVSGIGSRREVTAESLQLLLNSGALAADPGLEAWVRREYRLPERQDVPKPLPAGPPAKVPARGEAVAAPQPVDVEALDAAHDQAVQDMTERWQGAAGPLTTALAAAVAAETAGGALAGLAGLAVPASAVTALTGVVSAGLLGAASSAAVQAAAEVAPIRAVGTTLDAGSRGRITDLARSVVDLIVAGYRSAASRVAMAHVGADGDEARVRAAVADALTDLSQAKSAGLVAGSLSDAVLTAQGVGREQVLGALPDGTRYAAGEQRDRSTCSSCREADGQSFDSLEQALAARPTGRNPLCAGGLRCRGYIYAIAG